MKNLFFLPLIVLGLSACQTAPITSPTPAVQTDKIAFNITGKIGVTTQTSSGRTGGSAFYVWGQDDGRFTINLTGVLGVGATQIRYDGHAATLTNAQTTLTANSPNELLLKATGWHAPIDILPYWILGRVAKGDVDSIFDDGKLTQSTNDNWTARFEYKDIRPSRIVMTHTDGHRVVMTVTHNVYQ